MLLHDKQQRRSHMCYQELVSALGCTSCNEKKWKTKVATNACHGGTGRAEAGQLLSKIVSH